MSLDCGGEAAEYPPILSILCIPPKGRPFLIIAILIQ